MGRRTNIQKKIKFVFHNCFFSLESGHGISENSLYCLYVDWNGLRICENGLKIVYTIRSNYRISENGFYCIFRKRSYERWKRIPDYAPNSWEWSYDPSTPQTTTTTPATGADNACRFPIRHSIAVFIVIFDTVGTETFWNNHDDEKN